MKTILAALLLSFCAVASATDRSWSDSQIRWAAGAAVLHAIDWGQTRDIARQPDSYHERNPILGPHPTLGDVNRHFIVFGAVTAALVHFLPQYRDTLLKVYVGYQMVNTTRNFSIGLRLNF